MTELEVVYIILAIQAVGMLATTALYSFLRLKKEERKVKASEESAAANKAAFDSMTVYHAKRLELEEEKLDVERAKLKERGIDLKPEVPDPTDINEPCEHGKRLCACRNGTLR